MNVLYICDRFSSETVELWIEKLSLYEDGSDLVIYACSEGGDVGPANVLMDYIQRRFNNVELVIFNYAISAMWRFALLLSNVNKITVIGDAYAQDHQVQYSVSTNYSVTSNSTLYHNMVKKSLERGCKEWYEFCKKIGYTKKELKNLKDGNEIYFEIDRMKEILENSLVLRKN